MLTIVLSSPQLLPVAAFFNQRGAPRRYWWPTPASVGRLRKFLQLHKDDVLIVRLTGKAPYMRSLMKANYHPKGLGLSNTNKVQKAPQGSRP
jgi:hypothetical protein